MIVKMQIRCGTDIIEIDRIQEAIETRGEHFLDKIYTKKEIDYCESKKSQKYQHYAARFAAKEAVFKAISESLAQQYVMNWKDIEIENDRQGKPHVFLHGMANIGFDSMDISISHCRLYAVAYVTLILREGEEK